MQREQTGITGEFWFYSQLHRLGYESYITLGNTKSIDIVVKLNDKKGTTLSFDVKSKLSFGGSFQYLNIPIKENHFVVFINLKTIKEVSGKRRFTGEPVCYIVESVNLKHIASDWKSSKDTTKGYGFRDNLLWYLKSKDITSITKTNITDFKNRHGIIDDIDFTKYNEIILSLEDFENRYYESK